MTFALVCILQLSFLFKGWSWGYLCLSDRILKVYWPLLVSRRRLWADPTDCFTIFLNLNLTSGSTCFGCAAINFQHEYFLLEDWNKRKIRRETI